jgi:hypothetical protein
MDNIENQVFALAEWAAYNNYLTLFDQLQRVFVEITHNVLPEKITENAQLSSLFQHMKDCTSDYDLYTTFQLIESNFKKELPSSKFSDNEWFSMHHQYIATACISYLAKLLNSPSMTEEVADISSTFELDDYFQGVDKIFDSFIHVYHQYTQYNDCFEQDKMYCKDIMDLDSSEMEISVTKVHHLILRHNLTTFRTALMTFIDEVELAVCPIPRLVCSYLPRKLNLETSDEKAADLVSPDCAAVLSTAAVHQNLLGIPDTPFILGQQF